MFRTRRWLGHRVKRMMDIRRVLSILAESCALPFRYAPRHSASHAPSGPVFAGDYSATRRNPTTGRRGGPTSFTGWEAETEGQVHSIVVPRASGGVAGGINLIAASEKLLPAVEEPQIARYDLSFVRHKFDFSKTANGLFFGTNMHTFRQRSECL